MPAKPVLEQVFAALGVAARRLTPLKVVGDGNCSWRVDSDDNRVLVLRRYHPQATVQDLEYEHAVLRHAAAAGWTVPYPLSEPIGFDSALYCVTAFVPGSPVEDESAEQQAQRGRDLARLHVCLRDLNLGQRAGWRCQHEGTTVHSDVDWPACIAALRQVDSLLADWAQGAAETLAAELHALDAHELPVTTIHGDFASWNVHYDHDGRLGGVIDFGLTHLDSRPYELAMARTYRAPAVIAGYRAQLTEVDWPLSELEEALIEPMQRAFRLDIASWFIHSGVGSGDLDLAMIRRQLQRTGTTPQG